ncbi:MAG TPA: hypothetical protein ENN19_08255 [Chloroflexi bacterium]|nr:hypothetical protein [Chloroflexota bacterium]
MSRRTVVGGLLALLALSLLAALAPGEETWALGVESPRRQSIPTLTHTPGPATATATAEATATGTADEPAVSPTQAAPGDVEETIPAPVPTLISLSTPVPSPAPGAPTRPPTETAEDASDDDDLTSPRPPATARSTPSPVGDRALEVTPFVYSSQPLAGARCLGDLIVMGLGLLLLIVGLHLVKKRQA